MCGSNHDDNGEWHLSCSSGSGEEWGVGVVTKAWCQCVYEQQWSAVVVGCRAVLVWYSYMLQWLLSAVHLHPSQVDQFPLLIESHWWPGALLNISPCCPTLTTQTWSWSWNNIKAAVEMIIWILFQEASIENRLNSKFSGSGNRLCRHISFYIWHIFQIFNIIYEWIYLLQQVWTTSCSRVWAVAVSIPVSKVSKITADLLKSDLRVVPAKIPSHLSQHS